LTCDFPKDLWFFALSITRRVILVLQELLEVLVFLLPDGRLPIRRGYLIINVVIEGGYEHINYKIN
jgi:hypothetical protein